jgi:hypothetical protein
VPIRRKAFRYLRTFNVDPPPMMHPRLHDRSILGHEADLRVLLRAGLLSDAGSSRAMGLYEVGPQGFRHHEEVLARNMKPLKRVENTMRSHLDSGELQKQHPETYSRWMFAETRL